MLFGGPQPGHSVDQIDARILALLVRLDRNQLAGQSLRGQQLLDGAFGARCLVADLFADFFHQIDEMLFVLVAIVECVRGDRVMYDCRQHVMHRRV